MKKTITITKIIEKCGNCPNYRIGFLSEPSECDAIDPNTLCHFEYKFVKYLDTPPDWCPLENAE